MKVVKLMNSPQGRTGRALAGLALIAAGVLAGGAGGLVLAIVGLVPLAAGAMGLCLAARAAAGPAPRPLTSTGQ
jgi:hypothetical protein